MIYHNVTGTTASHFKLANGKNNQRQIRATETTLQVLDSTGENLSTLEAADPTSGSHVVTKKYLDSNIPSYNYRAEIAVDVSDSLIDNQIEVDAAVNTAAASAITNPAKWDAIITEIRFAGGKYRFSVYYYNGSKWIFLYNTTSGNRMAANNKYGDVISSNDITFTNGVGVVNNSAALGGIAASDYMLDSDVLTADEINSIVGE